MCRHRKYLTILWHFSTIFNLKIKIHEVTVFCGVSVEIKDKKGEDEILKKTGAICGCELVVAI